MFSNRCKYFVALAIVFIMASVPAQAQTSREDEIGKQLSSISPPQTVFDNITFTLDGDNVTLSGFTSRPARARDSERAVRSIPWVAEVINEIVVTSLTGSDEQIRFEALAILMKLIPRAFPQPWPNLRIKVHYGDVSLYGFVRPNEEFRLKSAIRQIEARPFVDSVENHVMIS